VVLRYSSRPKQLTRKGGGWQGLGGSVAVLPQALLQGDADPRVRGMMGR